MPTRVVEHERICVDTLGENVGTATMIPIVVAIPIIVAVTIATGIGVYWAIMTGNTIVVYGFIGLMIFLGLAPWLLSWKRFRVWCR